MHWESANTHSPQVLRKLILDAELRVSAEIAPDVDPQIPRDASPVGEFGAHGWSSPSAARTARLAEKHRRSPAPPIPARRLCAAGAPTLPALTSLSPRGDGVGVRSPRGELKQDSLASRRRMLAQTRLGSPDGLT